MEARPGLHRAATVCLPVLGCGIFSSGQSSFSLRRGGSMKKTSSQLQHEIWEPGTAIVVFSAFVSVLWVFHLLDMLCAAFVEILDQRNK
jgi:hypothetical protein